MNVGTRRRGRTGKAVHTFYPFTNIEKLARLSDGETDTRTSIPGVQKPLSDLLIFRVSEMNQLSSLDSSDSDILTTVRNSGSSPGTF